MATPKKLFHQKIINLYPFEANHQVLVRLNNPRPMVKSLKNSQISIRYHLSDESHGFTTVGINSAYTVFTNLWLAFVWSALVTFKKRESR